MDGRMNRQAWQAGRQVAVRQIVNVNAVVVVRCQFLFPVKLVLARGHAQLEARHRPQDALQSVPHRGQDLALAPQPHAVRHRVVLVEEAHLEFI